MFLFIEKLLAILSKHIEDANTSTKRVGNSCSVNIEKDSVFPSFSVDGPYGSPNQVNYIDEKEITGSRQRSK